MIDAIRSEWIKLRTVRGNVVLALLGVLIPVALATAIAAFGNFEFSDGLDTFGATVLAPGYLCVFLAGVVGVLGISQEYRHNTIRVTFTADASRSRVLAAKVAVTTLYGSGIALTSGLLSFLIAKLIFSARDISIGFTHPGENLAGFAGQIVLCALFTLAGFGLGAILRQPAAAIPILLLWPLIGEQVFLRLLLSIVGADGGAKWLPFQAGLSLPATGTGDADDLFGRVGSGLLFGSLVAVLVAIGWLLVQRRDA